MSVASLLKFISFAAMSTEFFSTKEPPNLNTASLIANSAKIEFQHQLSIQGRHTGSCLFEGVGRGPFIYLP